MKIDIHAHFAPPSLLETLSRRASEFPSVVQESHGDSVAFSFAGGKPTRPVAPGLRDIEGRLAWMDEQRIDRQLIGGWLDMFGYEMAGEEAETWSAIINEDLVRFCRNEPRFVPLGTVPLQDGERASRVLRDLRKQGVAGVMIGTQPDNAGGFLDADDLDPFWQTAHETGALIFIHPIFNSGDDRATGYGLENALGRLTDTTLAVARLLCAGHATRYSGANILAACGGAGLSFALGRLQRNHALALDSVADPLVEMRALYYDTILHDPAALKFLADKVGCDRLLMGSDKPFPIGDFEPMKIVADAGFTASEQDRINGGLAADLLGI